MREYLVKGIKKLEIELEESIVDKLEKYAELLYDYNSHTNLTAIRDKNDMLEKHFLDALLVHKVLPLRGGKGIDIGTGAGFPGMVLAICNPKIEFTLMDSVGKKTKFLELVKNELDLKNVIVVNGRAEEYIKDHRGEYDLGFCRGVNRLNVILEYMMPFLKVGGFFLPQKLEYKAEVEEAENALEILKGEIVEIYEEKLPFAGDNRIILKINKVEEIDKKYPRRTGVPLKRPL